MHRPCQMTALLSCYNKEQFESFAPLFSLLPLPSIPYTIIIIITINSFKAQFQTAQCAMQLWNNTGAKILHAYMKLYNIQIYMKATYNRRKYL